MPQAGPDIFSDRAVAPSSANTVQASAAKLVGLLPTLNRSISLLKQFVAAAAVAALTLAGASAGPLEDAATAHSRGDYTTMLNILREAADEGNSEAQFNIGIAYERGIGVPQDLAEAAKWYGRAAELGYAPAQVALGNYYRHGRGVPRDSARAAALYRSAAVQNDPFAAFILGTMHLLGEGVEKSHAQAMEWLRRAATKTSRSPLNHFHHSTAFGWTIWYPAHWRVDVSKIDIGEIVSITDQPPGSGLVSVNVKLDETKDQDQFLARWLAYRAAVGWNLIERKQQPLSDGTQATILLEEQPSPEGGKSLIAMVIKSDRIVWVAAETFKALWPEYETTLRGMVNSFSLR